MSRLNTMYPNDDFLKNISNMFGKIDSRNETEIKQEIEQIGYKEFYRYYKEKDIRINLLKDRIDKVIEYTKKQLEYSKKDCVPARRIVCEKILEILGVLDELQRNS